MSVRVHVAAAYGVDPQEFRAALEKAGGAKGQQSGPWCWLQASAWGVQGRDIDNGLVTFEAPSFRVTTVDGALWHLLLFHEGQRRLAFPHAFAFLRPSDPEDTGRAGFLTVLRDYEDYGITVTEELQRELEDLPFEEGRRRYVLRQAERLCDAFAEAGIPFSREDLTAVLTGESVTDEELDWDIGNLPRFLDVLGLGEMFPGWRDEIEKPEVCEEAPDEAPDYAADLIGAWEGVEPVALAGGPLECPVSELHRVCRIAWFCDEDIDAAVRVRMPGGQACEMDFSSAELLEARSEGVELRLGCPSEGGKWDTLRWTREAGPLLEGLPDGSLLELFTNSSYAVGRHCYRGPVHGGTWRIEAVSPPATRDAVEAALALSGYVDGSGALKARGPEDAQAIADTATRLYMLGDGGLKKPVVKGASVCVLGKNAGFERAFLALTAFRRWFADTWDTGEVQADLEESERQWDEMIASVGKAFEAAAAARIPRGAVVHEGEAATFHAVDHAPGAAPDAVARHDGILHGLGLQPFGDMTCSAVPGVELRGYASDDGRTVGVLMRAPFVEYVDFVTLFADGSMLTTTTTPGGPEESDPRLHKKRFTGRDLGKMYANHCRDTQELRERCGDIRPAPASLKALAEAMDDYLVRIGHGH